MSFSEKIKYMIDDCVEEFLNKISTKFNIEKEMLVSIWNTTTKQEDSINIGKKETGNLTLSFEKKETGMVKVSDKSSDLFKASGKAGPKVCVKSAVRSSVKAGLKTEDKMVDKTVDKKLETDIEKLSKKDLVAMCKQKKLKCTGTKENLIKIILDAAGNNQVKHTGQLNFKITKNSKLENSKKNNEFKIVKNEHGNYMHADTTFIFEKSSRKVIGKQAKAGEVLKLSLDDYETCKQYKFDYDIPYNLEHIKEENIFIEKTEDEESCNDELIEEELLEEIEEEYFDEEDD
jgi:hypothetical protein